jgi:hypothetical protein
MATIRSYMIASHCYLPKQIKAGIRLRAVCQNYVISVLPSMN